LQQLGAKFLLSDKDFDPEADSDSDEEEHLEDSD
jgi:hypothetical protein